MSPIRDDPDATPLPVDPETTEGVRLAREEQRARVREVVAELRGTVEQYKAFTPSHEAVEQKLTGLRLSLESKLVNATNQMASAASVAALERTVEGLRPPSFWKVISAVAGGALAVIGAVVTIVLAYQGRISDLATQNALLQQQVTTLSEAVKRIEASQRSTESKLDQLLIHSVGPKP